GPAVRGRVRHHGRPLWVLSGSRRRLVSRPGAAGSIGRRSNTRVYRLLGSAWSAVLPRHLPGLLWSRQTSRFPLRPVFDHTTTASQVTTAAVTRMIKNHSSGR